MPNCEAASRPRARGFTYFGLLMLLALFALASSLTLQVAEQSARREAERELLAIGTAFRKALASYYLQSPVGTRRYPGSLEELVRDPRFPGIKRHLRRVYIDPLTGKADWGVIAAPEGGIMGVYSKAEGQPIQSQRVFRLVPVLPDPQLVLSSASSLPQTMVASASSAPEQAHEATSYRDWQFGYSPNSPTPPPMQRRPAPLNRP